MLAIIAVYLGVFVALLGGAAVDPEGHAPIAGTVVYTGLTLAAAALALHFLRPDGLRASLAAWPSDRWLGIGLATGVGLVAFNFAWVEGLQRLLADGSAEEELIHVPIAPWLVFVQTVVIAPLLEEWADRGVLWTAARRVTGQWSTIFITAALFALLHGLGAGLFLEVPHRFVVGIALGLLRAYSGSLVPGIIAHAVNNLTFVLVSDA